MRGIPSLLLALAAFALLAVPAKAQEPVKPEQKYEQSKQDLAKSGQKDELRKEALNQIIRKAQEEYRSFFKEPKTALEFWAAATFEIQVGKFDIAAYHLDKLLKLPEKEADDDLLKIEEAEGLNAFLRLRQIKQWSTNADLNSEARKNVETLIDRVLVVLEKHLANRDRLALFVEGLSDKVPEVRAFSLYQLNRSKQRAAPVLAEALRNSKPETRNVLKNALLALDREIMPPLLELYLARNDKDAADVQFRMDLLWLAKARLEKRVIPYLWHMSSAPQYPKIVRDAARDTLAYLLDTTPAQLPLAKVALTQLAEQYYRHQVRFPDTTEVADRENPAKLLPMPAYKFYAVKEGQLSDAPEVLRPDDARLEFGLRYARQALDLDKSYLPAQTVFLAFLLESEFNRKPFEGQLDKLTSEQPTPALRQLLGKIDSDLLAAVIERAMEEQNYAVLLPLIDAAGDRGEVRLAQPSSANAPGPLVRLLYYPDRRVHYAAARALLRLPSSQAPIASTRIVEVLSRFLATDPTPRILIAFAHDERAAQLRFAAREAGYESDVAGNLKVALELLHKSAGYDAIVLNDAVPAIEMPYVITQLRADHNVGRLPLLLVASPAKQSEITALADRTRNCFVLPEAWAVKGSELKRQLEDAIKSAAAPELVRKAPDEQQTWLQYEVRRGKGQAVSEAEKKRFSRDALDWFAQMARGELPGYDLQPTKNALLYALNNDEMAVQALRVLARIPTAEIQQRLAGVIFDAKRSNLHVVAAQELNRHIQKNGLALTADQMNLLRQMDQQGDLPAALRVELAMVVGTLRTTPQMTGARLLNYGPEPELKK